MPHVCSPQPRSNHVTDEQEKQPTSRSRILKQARAEFAQFGFEGARVDRIAERADVNKAMLYYHFGSKEDLYLQSIKAVFDEVGPRLSRLINWDDSVASVFRAVAITHAELAMNNREIIPIMLRELANPDSFVLKAMSAAVRENGIPRKILQLLQAAQERGEIRPLDPRVIASSFVSMSFGFFLLAPLLKEFLSLPDEQQFGRDRIEPMISLVLDGLRPRPPDEIP